MKFGKGFLIAGLAITLVGIYINEQRKQKRIAQERIRKKEHKNIEQDDAQKKQELSATEETEQQQKS